LHGLQQSATFLGLDVSPIDLITEIL